jgi:hypothetical protein
MLQLELPSIDPKGRPLEEELAEVLDTLREGVRLAADLNGL